MYCAVSIRKNVCMHLAASQPLLVNPGFCAVHGSYLLWFSKSFLTPKFQPEMFLNFPGIPAWPFFGARCYCSRVPAHRRSFIQDLTSYGWQLCRLCSSLCFLCWCHLSRKTKPKQSRHLTATAVKKPRHSPVSFSLVVLPKEAQTVLVQRLIQLDLRKWTRAVACSVFLTSSL